MMGCGGGGGWLFPPTPHADFFSCPAYGLVRPGKWRDGRGDVRVGGEVLWEGMPTGLPKVVSGLGRVFCSRWLGFEVEV